MFPQLEQVLVDGAKRLIFWRVKLNTTVTINFFMEIY